MKLNKAKESFKEAFNKIRNTEYKSNRKSNTGIGKTFEDLVGVVENNKKEKDWDNQIEIKSQRGKSSSMMTLFCITPDSEESLKNLKDSYGKPDEEFKDITTLRTAISSNKYNSYNKTYGFILDVDRENETVDIHVRSHNTKELIETSAASFSFENLKNAFENKCSCIAYISADNRIDNDDEYFTFTEGSFLEGATFEDFLENIESGKIKYDLRMGSYKSGKKVGQPHDHGSAFRIQKKYILDFFPNQEKI